jgi:hypothetical protein
MAAIQLRIRTLVFLPFDFRASHRVRTNRHAFYSFRRTFIAMGGIKLGPDPTAKGDSLYAIAHRLQAKSGTARTLS